MDLLELMDPKDEGNIIRNVTKHSPEETQSYPRRLESSATPVRKHQTSRYPDVTVNLRGKQDRQCTYEARSRNHYYRTEEISITYSARVCKKKKKTPWP